MRHIRIFLELRIAWVNVPRLSTLKSVLGGLVKSLKVQQLCIALLAVLFAFSSAPQSSFATVVEPPPPTCQSEGCDDGDTDPDPEPEPEPTPEPTPVPPKDDDNDTPAPTPPDVLDCGMLYSNKAITSMNGKLTPLSETTGNVINNEVVLSVKRKMFTPNFLTVNITDAASNAMIVEKEVCWQNSSETDAMGRRMYKAMFSTTLVETAGKRNMVVLCDLKSANYVRTCAKTVAPDVMAN